VCLCHIGRHFVCDAEPLHLSVNGGPDQVARFIVMSLAGLVVSWCAMALTVDVLQWPY
jgi:hypothetical protein